MELEAVKKLEMDYDEVVSLGDGRFVCRKGYKLFKIMLKDGDLVKVNDRGSHSDKL